MKILFCTSEIAPFVKTGGLADVAGSFTKSIAAEGIDVRILVPKYSCIDYETDYIDINKRVRIHFVKNNGYFNREHIYGTDDQDYSDNLDRFSFYCKTAVEYINQTNFCPDIIHCNDWHTGLIPVFLKTSVLNGKVKTLFTIHNVCYQGIFTKPQVEASGLKDILEHNELLEPDGSVNLLKSALKTSDYISTVSPGYAKEIQSSDKGCGLENILYKRREKLQGILNGIDQDIWDPARDPDIAVKYCGNCIEKKLENKLSLQKQLGLFHHPDTALVSIVTRLVEQKGIDLIIQSIDRMMNKAINFILLGDGAKKYKDALKETALKYPNRISVNLGFDEILAHKIYAASDIFLMPSKYEPCGLSQLISLRYAAIPVVRKTGGLADTIFDYNTESDKGNGFVFNEYTCEDFLNALKRCLKLYENKLKWSALQKKVMSNDFSWKNSVKKYIQLYEKIINQDQRPKTED